MRQVSSLRLFFAILLFTGATAFAPSSLSSPTRFVPFPRNNKRQQRSLDGAVPQQSLSRRRHHHEWPNNTGQLSMVATTAASTGFAIAAGAISGGLFAGGLHAIAGTYELGHVCACRWNESFAVPFPRRLACHHTLLLYNTNSAP
jgi:hypothetical protein